MVATKSIQDAMDNNDIINSESVSIYNNVYDPNISSTTGIYHQINSSQPFGGISFPGSSPNIIGLTINPGPYIPTTSGSTFTNLFNSSNEQITINEYIDDDINLESITIYKKTTVALLWRLILWSQNTNNKFHLLTDIKTNTIQKTSLVDRFPIIAFPTKKVCKEFNEWCEKYNEIYGVDTIIPIPEDAYISGYMVQRSHIHNYKIEIILSQHTPSIEKWLIEQWAWISNNCKGKVYMLGDYWLFSNKEEAVYFKLCLDNTIKE